uniref:Uncharacterized protein n=1 Tax=Nymphaea colorata TaxID=210225 RepID=A0A5K1GQA3_9MAGN
MFCNQEQFCANVVDVFSPLPVFLVDLSGKKTLHKLRKMKH